jgi:hypothetical protein
MAIALADIYCWIKTIAQDTGKCLPDGYVFLVPQNVAAKVIVRYSVANDSHKPAGPLVMVQRQLEKVRVASNEWGFGCV